MINDQQTYDVVIAGGGMVGATLACALGDSGMRVAVMEAHEAPPVWSDQSRDLRVSAVSTGSVRVFKNLDVWERIASQRVSPFREMHVWDASGTGLIHFDSADIGADTLGYIVENRVIQAALWARAQEFDNVDWLCPARIDALQFNADYVSVHAAGRLTLRTRLLVGADGPDSLVRQLANIATTGWDYHQTALVASVKTSEFHQETAWQRFLGDGPLAFLPLTNGYCSIVWSLPAKRAEFLLGLDDIDFIRELQNALGPATELAGRSYGLGRIESVGPRASFPLRLIHANDYIQARLALIGDAAHTVHPLAGQGVNLGVADAAALAQIILLARRNRKDIGSLPVLRRYERWRKADNLLVVVALETIKRLFAHPVPAVRWLRNLGLRLTDNLSPVKNRIMLRAMGMNGELPDLARANWVKK